MCVYLNFLCVCVDVCVYVGSVGFICMYNEINILCMCILMGECALRVTTATSNLTAFVHTPRLYTPTLVQPSP